MTVKEQKIILSWLKLQQSKLPDPYERIPHASAHTWIRAKIKEVQRGSK